jgi:hypothetical protein
MCRREGSFHSSNVAKVSKNGRGSTLARTPRATKLIPPMIVTIREI